MSPGAVLAASRSRTSSSSGEPGWPGGTRAGLSATVAAQPAMSGSAPKAIEARVPRTFMSAHWARESPKRDGGQSRFFSSSS